jgi:SLOG cluster3 family
MNDAVASRIFLSASVPLPSRNPLYFDTADVIAIRDAVRALTMVVVEQHVQLVFGGHPAITPMIRLHPRNRELVEATFVTCKDDLRFPLQGDRPIRAHDRPHRSHSSVADIPSDTLAV